MLIKKAVALLAATALSVGSLTFFAPTARMFTTEAAILSNNFDVTYDGWTNYGERTKLVAVDTIRHNGSRSMFVSNRQSKADGAYSQKGFYLEGGKQYDYGVYVYHTQQKNETFHLKLTYLDSDGVTSKTVDIASKQVKSDEWTELKTQFTAPKNASDLTLTITTDSTADFYFDDFMVTGKTTTNSNTNVAYAATSYAGLKDRYAKYFKVGSVLNGGTVKNSTITATILKEFNSITFENELKPDSTMNKTNSSGNNVAVSISGAASLLDFCAKNNIGVRGHTFIWHSQTPEWVFKENFNASGNWVSQDAMDQRMESYIKNMFNVLKTQYPTLNLYAYDVANECISDDSNRTANYGGAREPGYGDGKSPWVQIYGDNKFLEKAFTFAKKYAPSGCSLFYNDYNEYWDHKRDCIASTCSALYNKGILDGIGMQSHIGSEISGFTGVSTYTTALNKFAAIGCQVQITELDVSTNKGAYTLDQQADKYKAIFQAAVNVNKTSTKGKVTAVCVWGPNDANTWVGAENAPLLFDVNNQPKPAYYAVAGIIPESEWGNGSTPTQTPNPTATPSPTATPKPTATPSPTPTPSPTATPSPRSAFSQIEAEDFNTQSGIQTESCTEGGNDVGYIENGDYVVYNNINFDKGAGSFEARVACSSSGGNIEIRLDSINGSLVGTCPVTGTGGWQTWTTAQCSVSGVSGSHDLYLKFTGGSGYLFNLNWWKFNLTPSVKYGDINGDGSINAIDYSLLKSYLLSQSTTIDLKASDLDGDGRITSVDCALLNRYILGKITQFPVSSK